MAPSIWLFCRAPELLKVQEIFSTMSTKISSRTLPSVREVSRMDLMTPVGPLPTPEKSDPLPLYTAHVCKPLVRALVQPAAACFGP